VLIVLAITASGSAVYAWQQLKSNEAFLTATLKTATEIVNTAVAQAEKYNVPRTATLELLIRAEGLFHDMALLGRQTRELRHQKALMLIAFAANYALLGNIGKARQRAEEAHFLLAGLSAEKPDHPEYTRDLLRAQAMLLSILGLQEGNFAEGFGSLKGILPTWDRLAKTDPGNARWQRDLAHYYGMIGLYEKIDLLSSPEALKYYKVGLATIDRLAKADPNNADLQHDLAGFYQEIGDVLRAQGDLGGALKSYQDGLAIMDRLAEADTGNVRRQALLSDLYEGIGGVLLAQGDLGGALKSFQDGLAIIDRLAKIDPGESPGSLLSPIYTERSATCFRRKAISQRR
jgi:tetratricopeptide (TPR) repeat protein